MEIFFSLFLRFLWLTDDPAEFPNLVVQVSKGMLALSNNYFGLWGVLRSVTSYRDQ